MDVTDIGRVASRKRMNTDAEKLREKVSRETAKIIKLKVAQDTAYWDLKERLQQLQGAHERLQQNMVDVQMQHEAASARYTQELRLRPDTLNKVAGARGVCDVLEEYGARLRRCVARGRADRDALAAAYAQCGARMRGLAAELARARAARAAQRDAARESAARALEQARQLEAAREQLGVARVRADERAAARDQLAARLRQVSTARTVRQRGRAPRALEQARQLEAAREQLGVARVRADERAAARDQLAARLRQVSTARTVRQRGRAPRALEQARQLEAAREQLGVARVRADERAAARDQLAARLRQVSTARTVRQRGRAPRALEQARQLEAAREQLGVARVRADERAAARDQLAARLRQADEAAAAMRDEVSRLVRQFDAQTAHMQQTIARQEDEARAAGAEGERLRREADALQDRLRRALDQLADAKDIIEHMKQKEATQVDGIKTLEKVISDKSQHEHEMETELSSIRQCVRQLETEKLEASEKLHKSEQECGALRTALDDLTRASEQLRAQLADQQAAHQAQRDADAAQRAELGAAAAAKDRELDANTGTIARLMTDLKSESDARARCDAALGAARRQHEAEQLAARALEQQLRDAAARLELAAQAKDDELGAQMTIILDMRGEKERLQERIQGMQNTIDNIQKELTGRLAAPKGAADVGEPPELDAGPHEAEPHATGARKARPLMAEPRRPEPREAELYSFLSDGSVDGDVLDPREVGRRFEALRGDGRGVRLAAQGSISLSQVKDDLKIKNRTFFKNKRFDSKPKKFK